MLRFATCAHILRTGMDVYTVNLGGTYHDDFYTNPKIIAAFKVRQHFPSTVIFEYSDDVIEICESGGYSL